MTNWLKKTLDQLPTRKGNLPAQAQPGQLPGELRRTPSAPPQTLPNATVIYGIGAALLYVAAFSLVIHRHWFPALLIFALGVCLTGFALHLLKHQD